jgi:deoxyribonuclease V
VDYRPDGVVAAGVGFTAWPDATPAFELVVPSAVAPAPYQAGQFYRRELPYLVDVVRGLPTLPDILVVDGFVWLDAGVPGLGAHLFDALGQRAAVVGIAKRPHGNFGVPVLRGDSRRPLLVTAAGVDPAVAAAGVAAMHGRHRLPTLIKRADRLSRERPHTRNVERH